MANTFELIASSTVGSGGSSSLSFTSIPSTYTDLCLLISLRTAQAGASSDCRITLNGTNTGLNSRGLDSRNPPNSWNYTNNLYLVGGGNGNTSTASTFTNWQIYIPNYASTTTYKSVSGDYVRESNDNNSGQVYCGLVAGIYNSNTAITSVGVENDGNNNYLQYTTAYLYGVKNA